MALVCGVVQVSVFAFTFRQSGTYVFASSTDADAQTVVVVLEAGRSCGVVDGPIAPMSAGALTALGVIKARSTVLTPNWQLLGLLVGGLMAVVVVILTVVMFFRKRGLTHRGSDDGTVVASGGKGAKGAKGAKGTIADKKAPSGSKVADEAMLVPFAGAAAADGPDGGSAGAPRLEGGDKQGAGPAGGDGGDGDDDEEEDFRALINQLHANHAEVSAAFLKQQQALQDILDATRREADEVKALLAAASTANHGSGSGSASGPGADTAASEEDANARASLALRQVEAEVAMRAMHDALVAQREGEVMVALQALCEQLRNDPRGVAEDLLQVRCGVPIPCPKRNPLQTVRLLEWRFN